ncbi:proteasome subunit alpha type-4-like [Drosophila madeirensis]|uniref:Proteasome subunit alpha type-4-like n=1 Tax=Drosophila madeirensis TaxID=30013 RepID=A0AAU9G3D8_DROMD
MSSLCDPQAIQFSANGWPPLSGGIRRGGCLQFHTYAWVCLLAAECRNSRLIGSWPSEKMFRLANNVACSYAATKLIDEMRRVGPTIPCERLVADTCTIKQSYIQCGGRRPFGVSVLFMGWDELHGCQLYAPSPSGSYKGHLATATGQHFQAAKSLLEQVLAAKASIHL